MDKLNESLAETEETLGLKLDDSEMYTLAGRGSSYTSTKTYRPWKQPVRVVREIAGRFCSCHEGIHGFHKGLGNR